MFRKWAATVIPFMVVCVIMTKSGYDFLMIYIMQRSILHYVCGREESSVNNMQESRKCGNVTPRHPSKRMRLIPAE